MKSIYIDSHSEEKYIDLKITEKKCINQIEGKIRDSWGDAIENACVKIVSTSYAPLLHTISDSEGNFVLLHNFPEEIMLIFSKEGYSTLLLPIYCDHSNITLERNIDTSIISGKVVFSDNSQISPTRLRLENSKNSHQVYSDEEGFFHFTKVFEGKYTLIIDGNECKRTVVELCLCENLRNYDLGCIEIEKINIRGTIHGVVKNCENVPVEDVVVILYEASTNKIIANTLTEKEGLYFFGNVEIGEYYVKAYN